MTDQAEPTPRAVLAAIQTQRHATGADICAIYGFDALATERIGSVLLVTADRAGRRVIRSFTQHDVVRSGSVLVFELDVMDALDAQLRGPVMAPPAVLS